VPDGDGYFDRYELDLGSDPADPSSIPPPTTTTTSTTAIDSTTETTSTTGVSASSTTTTSQIASTSTTTLAPVSIGTTSLILRDHTTPSPDPSKRKITFTASTKGASPAKRIVPPARGSAGDPTVAGGELRVSNALGLTTDDVVVALPVGWSALGSASKPKGYRYANPSGPIRAVKVTQDTIVVKGGGAGWTYTLDEAKQGAVAVRLQLGAASPWCGSAAAKTAHTDRVDRFVGRPKSPAPASCPAP
jgi:hypothetical protein